MYNDAIKTEFIDQYAKTDEQRTECLRVFNATQKYEELWKSDVCTFSADEIEEVFGNSFGVLMHSKVRPLIILKEYAMWCNDNQKVKDVSLEVFAANIRETSVDQFKTTTVANPKQFKIYLDSFLSSSDDSIDNSYKCAEWLIYFGVEPGDVASIKTSDVDFEKFVICYNKKNTVVQIYPEALREIKNCVNLTEFTVQRRSRSLVKLKRIDGDMLIRGCIGKPNISIIETAMKKKLVAKGDETKLWVTPHNVWLSGLFYRTYEDEVAGIPPESNAISKYVDEKMRTSNYKLDSKYYTESKRRRQIYCHLYNDYARWKLAWHS